MQISEENRVKVLLDLSDKNRKGIDWVKELDFKVVYYTLFLFAGVVTFVATRVITSHVRCVLFTTTVFVALLAIGFLVRNHIRHAALLGEDERIKRALQLTEKGIYGVDAVCERPQQDLAFLLGRVLYVIAVLVGAALVGALVWLLTP